MDEREKVLTDLHRKFLSMLKKDLWHDLFCIKTYAEDKYKTTSGKPKDSIYKADDIVAKVFELFLKEMEKDGITDPGEFFDQFRLRVKNLKKIAINKFFREHRSEVMLIQDKNIKDRYEKVMYYVEKELFDERAAKWQVRIDESLQRGRSLFSQSLNVPTYSDDDPEQHYEKDLPDESKDYSGESFVDKDFYKFLMKAHAKCIKKLKNIKNKNNDRDFRIVLGHYISGIKKIDLAEKYGLTDNRIGQIVNPAVKFIKDCVRSRLNQAGIGVPYGL